MEGTHCPLMDSDFSRPMESRLLLSQDSTLMFRNEFPLEALHCCGDGLDQTEKASPRSSPPPVPLPSPCKASGLPLAWLLLVR